jgi:hypothetical protein
MLSSSNDNKMSHALVAHDATVETEIGYDLKIKLASSMLDSLVYSYLTSS